MTGYQIADKAVRENGRIGLAVITYNRVAMLGRCLAGLDAHAWGGADERIIIVDEPHDERYTDDFHADIYFAERNAGVAAAKNRAFSELLRRGCDHVFTMEDDVTVCSDTTCLEYVEYAQTKGLHHLNYGLHGPGNKGRLFSYRGVTCYPSCIGAFSYYSRTVLEKVGVMDEAFVNSMEHIDHTWRIAAAGYTLPFWYFADHPQSDLLIRDLDPGLGESVIRSEVDRDDKRRNANAHWLKKHGCGLPKRPRLLKWQMSIRKRFKLISDPDTVFCKDTP